MLPMVCMKLALRVLFFSIVTFVCHAGAQTVSVTSTDSANALVNSILGSGISLIGNPVYTHDTIGASGTFTNGLSAGLGLDAGLIMTTGYAASAAGPNLSTHTSGPG